MKRNYLSKYLCFVAIAGLVSGCDDDGTGTEGADSGTPMVVNSLTSPADGMGYEVDLMDDGLPFEWPAAVEATTRSQAAAVTYRIVFDTEEGDFSRPLYTVTSDNKGAEPRRTLSKNLLVDIALSAGALAGDEVALRWCIMTESGSKKLLSTASNLIYFTFSANEQTGSFNVGDPLYIAGEASEAGQQFKYVGAETYDYEIYTWLEPELDYYISSADDGTGHCFAVNSEKTGFTQIAPGDPGSKVSAGKVYRIRLSFATNTVTMNMIDYIWLRYCNAAGRDVELKYMGSGVWKVSDYNVVLTKPNFSPLGEERYKFIFQMDGLAKGSGEHWGMNGAYSTRFTLATTPDDYYDLKQVGTGQWAGAFKFPDDFVDLDDLDRYYTDVLLYMNNDHANYTHELQNYYDATTLPPPWPIEWEAAADSCTFVLIDQFLNKNRGTFWSSAKNVLNNSSSLYWQQAYPVHTMLFSHERIKASNPALAQEYKTYFERWVDNDGNNYTGQNGRRNGFYCSYTDDMAWMSLVLLHASELFVQYSQAQSETYYTLAKQIYDEYMLESSRVVEDEEGWGLRWRLSNEDAGKDTRNACTNTPAMIIACKLYQKTGTQKYLDDAIKLFDFMTKTGNRVQDNGAVAQSPNILTYTQGTWIEGCRLLYHITGESKYMDRATICATYTMSSDGACTTATGVLRGEGQSADQSNFKGGLIPYMVNYANDTDMPSDVRQQVKEFLIFNGETLWRKNVDRKLYPKMYVNFSWEMRYNIESNPGSLGAHNSGAALLEGITRLQ